MHTAKLRKVGGSIVLAVPRPLLDQLHLLAGSKVDLGIDNGGLVIAPRARPRYMLDQLLANASVGRDFGWRIGSCSRPSRPAMRCCSGAWRYLSRLARSDVPAMSSGAFARCWSCGRFTTGGGFAGTAGLRYRWSARGRNDGGGAAMTGRLHLHAGSAVDLGVEQWPPGDRAADPLWTSCWRSAIPSVALRAGPFRNAVRGGVCGTEKACRTAVVCPVTTCGRFSREGARCLPLSGSLRTP